MCLPAAKRIESYYFLPCGMWDVQEIYFFKFSVDHQDVCDVKIFIIADSARVTFVLLNEKASVEHHRSYVRLSK